MEKENTSTLKPCALVTLLGLAVLAGGCAAVVPFASMLGSPNSSALEIHNNTEVRLDEKNFVVVKTNVVGQCSGFSLLGVLTIVPAKFTKAMNRLYAKAAMEPGRSETLVNLIMERDSTFLILFSLPRIAVRADVVEFIPSTGAGSQARSPPEGVGSKIE